MTKKAEKNNTGGNWKYIKWFWSLIGIGLLVIVLLFLLASWGAFGTLPTFEELENPETNLATEILSSDGETLGKFYRENRTPVNYEDLPEHLVQALIATEDERFYNHAGIDARGTLRALAFLGQKGGASTITQQLATQLFTGVRSRNTISRVIQKIKEWVIATRLERQYTKDEILTMYLNKYDFLNQAVGIRSASRIYFGKEPKELTTAESAMLVGMLKNSSLFNPLRREEMVLNRRNVVLKQMEKNNFLSAEVKDSLQQLPLGLNYSPEGHDEGLATYFREFARAEIQNWINDNPRPDGSKYNIYRDGLKIFTTIDSKMQQYAEESVHAHLTNLQKEFDRQNKNNNTAPFRGITIEETEGIIKNAMRRSDRWRNLTALGKTEEEIIASFNVEREMKVFSWKGDIDTIMKPIDSIKYYKSYLQSSLMSMNPQTGEVKAWVGGVNYKHFKYDMVKQGKRQVGSTFKPFVYATAIDQLHMSPCDTLPNTPYTIEEGKYGLLKPWTPKNAGDKYGGMVNLIQALAESHNVISANLIDKTGPQPVIDLVSKLGINTSEMSPVPAIALGTTDISLFEMVAAYAVFANEGIYVEPVMIFRIEDKNGTVLFQHVPNTRDVISAESAYVTTKLLEGVTQGGSGGRLRRTWPNDFYENLITGYPYGFTNPIAGKTGTTQNQSDGWFMGMVPNLVTGVWVGAEDRSARFPTITYGQGATMALPIWGLYMKKCYENEDLGVSKEDFKRPENLSIETDCSKWKEANEEDNILDEFSF
ncbi:penicillin-binding protein 1A [Planktosalinus lacus]|uniref:Penicillin-binding protein 1A n=1 Tax=Planktosalinus lacus TaxID=1526573 RepID=A0A8J2Y7T9_9FLAO|nr:PBP1A family penicillin-binding protein [Planktosalinus lacus]GGD79712.1 penicillin-binding protein 1A [Planktosalinus lacus]